MAKGAFAPNWADLRNIHGLIGERKPKVVVELGGGCSTVIIAHAIEENLKELGTAGRLYSFDGSEYWQKNLIDKFPDRLRGHVEFLLGREEAREMFGEQVRVCTNVETDAPTPNLLYVDGLDVVPNVPIGAEAIEIEKIAPDDFFLLVDGRAPTVAFLKKHLSRDFEVFTHPLDSWTTFRPLPVGHA